MSDFKIIRKTTRIEFWQDDEYYIYEVTSDSSTNTEIIYKNDELIYATDNKNSNEAELILDLIKTKI